MTERSLLLVIDMQNDFVNGSLPVHGAKEDTDNIVKALDTDKFSKVILTMDSHYPIHVGHPCGWMDKDGNEPEPFTQITIEDIKSGKWQSKLIRQPEEYLSRLGTPQTIWPYHCILGTEGWCIYPPLMKAVTEWTKRTGVLYDIVQKGMSPKTEQYSIFRAAVPIRTEKTTFLNIGLLAYMDEFDRIYICGEAADYCVKNSIKTLVDEAPWILSKVTILTDCTSPISNDFSFETDDVYQEAVKCGVTLKTTEEI